MTTTGQRARRRADFTHQGLRQLLYSPFMPSAWHTRDVFAGKDLAYIEYLEEHIEEIAPDPKLGYGATKREPIPAGHTQEGGWGAVPGCGCGYTSAIVPYSIAVEWAQADEAGKEALIERLPEIPLKDPLPGYCWYGSLNHVAFIVFRLDGEPLAPPDRR